MVGPETSECEKSAAVMHAVCEKSGLPVEPDKDEGPATMNTFLGMELDSIELEIRLPQEKLGQLKQS